MKKSILRRAAAFAFAAAALNLSVFAAKPGVELRVLGSYAAGGFNLGAAEIVAHDPSTQRLFVVNGATSKIDVLSIANPSNPTLAFSIDLALWGRQANSVDIYNGIIAAAVEANVRTDPGKVVFFDTDGNYLNDVPAGALPDMVTFTPNGEFVLVANEGEPNSYGQANSVDPDGSVTRVDLRGGVENAVAVTLNFAAFNDVELDPSIRIYGPGASVQKDLEPEYIAVDNNSRTAWITLQENNALAVLDIKSGVITDLIGLGFKDYSLEANKLDAGDRDGASNAPRINIVNRPVFGMYEPDAIATLKYKDQTFLVTANEGDARDYTGFSEEIRVGSSGYVLDSLLFPNAAALKTNAQLGRLNATRATGDTDGDGDFDAIYTLGGRSFSIWTADGEQVYDSRDEFEQKTAAALPNFFNASNDNNNLDDRSDNKGPEPEGLTIGKAYGRSYAFITLERVSGIMVYDVTNPFEVEFVQYINNRNFGAPVNTAAALDLGPEGVHFISDEDSPIGVPLLAVANEVSGTTTVYEFVRE